MSTKPEPKPVSNTVDNLTEFDFFMALEPYESKEETISNEDNSTVTTNAKFFESDLVWAKVRSHPWWPGQVFNSSTATEKAKKLYKKGNHLVTYFGDDTFAWNESSRIKPFRRHFSQMAKQSSLPDFIDAVDFALEEVSRRIEFGLACTCMSKEVYKEIEIQNVINPGVREESSRVYRGDKFSSVTLFQPTELVGYVKRLASSVSYEATDELKFVSHKAQLLAFNRFKGFTDLPEFETLRGSVESATNVEQVYTKRRKIEDSKRDNVFEYEDASVNTTVVDENEKTLAEFIAEIRLRIRNCVKLKPDSEKKRIVVDSEVSKPKKKKIKVNVKTEEDTPTVQKARSSFGIGASIMRVANQMNCSTTPTGLKPCSNSTSKKSLKERHKAKALAKKEISSPSNEMPSSPHSASVNKTTKWETKFDQYRRPKGTNLY